MMVVPRTRVILAPNRLGGWKSIPKSWFLAWWLLRVYRKHSKKSPKVPWGEMLKKCVFQNGRRRAHGRNEPSGNLSVGTCFWAHFKGIWILTPCKYQKKYFFLISPPGGRLQSAITRKRENCYKMKTMAPTWVILVSTPPFSWSQNLIMLLKYKFELS